MKSLRRVCRPSDLVSCAHRRAIVESVVALRRRWFIDDGWAAGMLPYVSCSCGGQLKLSDEVRSRLVVCPTCGVGRHVPGLQALGQFATSQGQRTRKLEFESRWLLPADERQPILDEPDLMDRR